MPPQTQPLNNHVCLQPIASRERSLIITDRFAKFLVRAVHDKSQLKPGDVVVCPVNSGFEYEGMKVVDERALIAKAAK